MAVRSLARCSFVDSAQTCEAIYSNFNTHTKNALVKNKRREKNVIMKRQQTNGTVTIIIKWNAIIVGCSGRMCGVCVLFFGSPKVFRATPRVRHFHPSRHAIEFDFNCSQITMFQAWRPRHRPTSSLCLTNKCWFFPHAKFIIALIN